jgi:hypothetical protein
VSILEVRGEPSDEEVAAIMAASSEVFATVAQTSAPSRSIRWRFSGRSWMQNRFDNRPG